MTLSNIKDQRKRFQKAPTPPRGRIKQNREYHNQSRSTPPGEQAPPIIHLQTKFPHKKTKVTKKIHREREKHSTRFRKRGRTIPMHSQNQTNFSHGGRHKSRMQFQNQPETMNSAFPKHRRPFNSSHQLSNKQLLRGISLMRSRFNTTQFYNQKILFRAGEGEIYPKQGLRQESSTTPRSTTLWSQWLPPHSVLDEYYDSDEGKKATKRDKKATDSREKHGWVGWDGGDFMHFYHPNDPKYGLDPKVPIPSNPTFEPTSTTIVRTQRIYLTMDDECDNYIYYCMEGFKYVLDLKLRCTDLGDSNICPCRSASL